MAEHILKVELTEDHLKNDVISTAKEPIKVISELIWNALDADATKVEIDVKRGAMVTLESISVKDNGHGISYEELKDSFGFLGNSPKKYKEKSPSGRIYHGKKGKGRYASFSLGDDVIWDSVYSKEKDGKNYNFKISKGDEIINFNYSDPEVTREETGVRVTISDIGNFSQSSENTFENEALEMEICATFAHYLTVYKKEGIQLFLNGTEIHPHKAIVASAKQNFTLQKEHTGEVIEIDLHMYQWKNKIRKRCFCTDDGVVIEEDASTGVQHKDFGHSIYISSPYFKQLEKENTFGLLKSDDLYDKISCKATEALYSFLRSQLSKKAKEKLSKIKETGIYPFKEEPQNSLEEAERQIFDIFAEKVISSPKNAMGTSTESKALVLELLKEASEKDPKDIVPIFSKVLDLPDDEAKELSNLLDDFSLSSLIKISRKVTDRIQFIEELDEILFDTELKKKILERKHLHKILEKEVWIFGDGYEIGTSDKSLKNLLKKHIKILGREDLVGNGDDEKLPNFIPDLFLYKSVPQAEEGKFEHLIIELKRPGLVLKSKELTQIKEYAIAVANDSRFDKDNVRWKFVLIGNELDALTKDEARQSGRPKNCVIQPENGNYEVYVMQWSELLGDLKWKYSFIKNELSKTEQSPEELKYVKEKYGDMLPDDV